MTSSQTYLIGFIVFVIGLAFGAFYLGAPPIWIAIGAVILIGLGIMAAARYSTPVDRGAAPPSDTL